MGFSVSGSMAGVQNNGYVYGNNGNNGSSGSRRSVESELTKLNKQRDDYERQKKESGSYELDGRIANLEKRINDLQKRLNSLKEKTDELDDGECQTCKNRKYQDGSDDPGVSFKSPGKIDPASAEAVVRSHEYEHVNHNQAKASREDREVVYQSVIIKHGICPECGDTYVTGGETTTVTKKAADDRFSAGLKDSEQGKVMNLLV